jgi:hypothetical protein
VAVAGEQHGHDGLLRVGGRWHALSLRLGRAGSDLDHMNTCPPHACRPVHCSVSLWCLMLLLPLLSLPRGLMPETHAASTSSAAEAAAAAIPMLPSRALRSAA